MTTKQPLSEEPSTTTNLTSLQPPVAPPPPQFPTFSELVELEAQEQATPKMRRLTDLFDGTLGDPTLLVSDYQRNPEKYGDEVKGLLEQLMQGSKSVERLTTSERRLLNLATFDYFQAPPLKKEPPVTHGSNKGKPRPQAPRKAAPKREKPRPGIDVPVTELPAYWWLQ
jgi:hypothetical protein